MLPSNEATPAGPPPHIIRSLSNDVDGTATVTSFPSKHWNGSFYGNNFRDIKSIASRSTTAVRQYLLPS
jgi:hypothetical protein